jgi:hypothetical protein
MKNRMLALSLPVSSGDSAKSIRKKEHCCLCHATSVTINLALMIFSRGTPSLQLTLISFYHLRLNKSATKSHSALIRKWRGVYAKVSNAIFGQHCSNWIVTDSCRNIFSVAFCDYWWTETIRRSRIIVAHVHINISY